jgi:hypothetical protein
VLSETSSACFRARDTQTRVKELHVRRLGMMTTAVGVAAIVVMTRVVIASLPDIRRYLNMRSM